jgi:hypothetical protein
MKWSKGNWGLVVLLAASAACSSSRVSSSKIATGSTRPTTTLTLSTVATSTTPPTSAAPAMTAAPPHFDTPEAAMTYLATAWNTNDVVWLRHVTNPAARAQLDAMHSEAVNLRLDHRDRRPQGDNACTFRHDYPAATATTMPGGIGEAVFLVGPALTPGWYMTVFQSCG